MSEALLTRESRGAIEIVTLKSAAGAQRAFTGSDSGNLCLFPRAASPLDVRVVIPSRAGRHFCAGADLESVAFAEQGSGRAQRQMGDAEAVLRRSESHARPARSRSSLWFKARLAAAVFRSRWPPTCATRRRTCA